MRKKRALEVLGEAGVDPNTWEALAPVRFKGSIVSLEFKSGADLQLARKKVASIQKSYAFPSPSLRETLASKELVCLKSAYFADGPIEK